MSDRTPIPSFFLRFLEYTYKIGNWVWVWDSNLVLTQTRNEVLDAVIRALDGAIPESYFRDMKNN